MQSVIENRNAQFGTKRGARGQGGQAYGCVWHSLEQEMDRLTKQQSDGQRLTSSVVSLILNCNCSTSVRGGPSSTTSSGGGAGMMACLQVLAYTTAQGVGSMLIVPGVSDDC